MLPFPGSPSSSWAMYRSRLKAAFAGADPRVLTAFWLFGLINNVLYVIILSAALDLVGPDVPKSVVLLADVIPSFMMKLIAPYFIQAVPYSIRILLLVAISTVGMLLIALTPEYTDGGTISTKMIGVILASLSSGGGELSFLGLTHFYGPFSLAAWGSGTGAAGLVGAGAYAVATTSIGLSVRTTLLVSSFLPVIMLLSFFAVLPLESLKRKKRALESPSVIFEHEEDQDREDEGLLGNSQHSAVSASSKRPQQSWRASFTTNLRRARSLFFPYMLPLLLVYTSEYLINQSLHPLLLFPLPSTPFAHYRSFYPTYATLYQLGVFVSRSSLPLLRIRNLYLPSLLQCANFILLLLHALFPFLPNVWVVFAMVFWEGLLGGAVYVNTFAAVQEGREGEDREWSLGAVSVSDSAGICLAGMVGLGLEGWVCGWQVAHGRGWCKQL